MAVKPIRTLSLSKCPKCVIKQKKFDARGFTLLTLSAYVPELRRDIFS